MISPCHDVAVAGEETALPQPNLGLRKERAVGGYVAEIAESDRAFLAAQDGASADVGVCADNDPLVGRAFGVKDSVVVDEGVGPDPDLVGMTEGDVPAEGASFPDSLEDPGKEDLPKEIARRLLYHDPGFPSSLKKGGGLISFRTVRAMAQGSGREPDCLWPRIVA